MYCYTYILQNTVTRRLYIGVTDNLPRRITEHYTGKTLSLRKRMPLILIHIDRYATRSEAIQREIYLKKLKNGNEMKRILAHASIASLADFFKPTRV